ncbi:MAG: HAMP domain-containing histidine kinase [Pontiellaceae bacterium]|nr:HAMP domain-containing histidine kinase [Pontiellaceae bacterium]
MAAGFMNRRSQFQWVVLLAMAVVVPTVSLLWFMSRAVANERLVILQKLGAIYQQRLEHAGDLAKRDASGKLYDAFGRTNWPLTPNALPKRIAQEDGFLGAVCMDGAGRRIYPIPGVDDPADSMLSGGPLTEAWGLEFVEQDYAAAAARYKTLAETGDSRALAGLVRCLAKQGLWNDATAAAMQSEAPDAAPARLLIRPLVAEEKPEGFNELLTQLDGQLEKDLFHEGTQALPSEQNLFIARKLLDSSETGLAPVWSDRLDRLISAEAESLALLEIFPQPAGPTDTLVPLSIDGRALYTIRYKSGSFGEMQLLLDSRGLASLLNIFSEEFRNTDASFRIFDAQGMLLLGEAGEGREPIASMPLPTGFPEGQVEVFFASGDVFEQAANRQITVYVWTGALVILLMLAVGVFAVQAVGRQIRLNKMKNDFIATVSHELKTPLASMRLLVDTLLEGRVRDENHAREYLQMIARENERLTRMIENFLSFSRMERNKNAFTFAAASPLEIVEDAIDSVGTKYRTHGCRLDTEFADHLPDIHADHDAVVTVLINLLDNACKYTNGDKQIRLHVFAEGSNVCFAVSDNGIGMSIRQLRRIFDHFYQIDNSLARTTEGCGLGLSIVRFIVNAHKGRVDVDSEPGKGSTFTVRLPQSA